MTSCDPKLLAHPDVFEQKYVMSVTDGIGQTPCSFENYLVNKYFTHLLCVPIYTILQIFIQLSPTMTKLCHTKRDHPSNFYISLELNF